MIYLLCIVGVVSCILFIGWQWKMLKKYALNYDKLAINHQEQCVTINGQSIPFADIDFVSVRELPQPALLEKALSRGAFYAYMAHVEFHLKNESVVPATCNAKGVLYQTLKRLEKVIPVRANVESYKPSFVGQLLLWILIVGMLMYVFKVG